MFVLKTESVAVADSVLLISQTVVPVLVACLEVWVACQVVQVGCLIWVVPQAVLAVQAVLADPLLRKLTKLRFSRYC